MLPINLTPVVESPPTSGIVPPPAGYGLFRARKWGDPIVVAEAGLSTALFETSNFQVVPVYVPETGVFSATAGNNSKYLRSRGDMDAIWNLQPKDGRTMEAMFNPIIHTGNYTKTMWTNDASLDWKTSPKWVAGTQCYGGQMVAATLETFLVRCQMPNRPYQNVTCRKIYPFRREHFKLSHATHPWLINKYTVAFRKPREDTYSEVFNGLERYLPMQVLDPRDFEFTGRINPSAFYIPAGWLESVS